MMMIKKKKKKQNDSPSEVSFSCRGCNKEMCRGEDIEVVSLMHHVVVSTEFRYGEHKVKGHVKTLLSDSLSVIGEHSLFSSLCGQLIQMSLFTGVSTIRKKTPTFRRGWWSTRQTSL